jgi:hypothetical protein
VTSGDVVTIASPKGKRVELDVIVAFLRYHLRPRRGAARGHGQRTGFNGTISELSRSRSRLRSSRRFSTTESAAHTPRHVAPTRGSRG